MVAMRNDVFCIMKIRDIVDGYLRSGRTFGLHVPDRRVQFTHLRPFRFHFILFSDMQFII